MLYSSNAYYTQAYILVLITIKGQEKYIVEGVLR